VVSLYLIYFSFSATILTVRVICGVGILLFLIASAIILSLIPLYLPGHGSTINYVTSRK
jgi:hypothetical protein